MSPVAHGVRCISFSAWEVSSLGVEVPTCLPWCTPLNASDRTCLRWQLLRRHHAIGMVSLSFRHSVAVFAVRRLVIRIQRRLYGGVLSPRFPYSEERLRHGKGSPGVDLMVQSSNARSPNGCCRQYPFPLGCGHEPAKSDQWTMRLRKGWYGV